MILALALLYAGEAYGTPWTLLAGDAFLLLATTMVIITMLLGTGAVIKETGLRKMAPPLVTGLLVCAVLGGLHTSGVIDVPGLASAWVPESWVP